MTTKEYVQSDIELTLGANSRYSDTPVFRAGNNLILNTFENPLPKIEPSTSYVLVDGKYQGRLDLISADVYGDANLWWFIAYSNNIIDPFTEVVSGIKLFVPPIEDALNKDIYS